MIAQQFHGSLEKRIADNFIQFEPTIRHYTQIVTERKLHYQFYPHFHPYILQLLNRLIQTSVAGLEAADTEYQVNPNDKTPITFPPDYQDESKRGKPKPKLYEDFFQKVYSPNPDNIEGLVESPYPVKELDFSSAGAYSVYNWELFYHIPLTIFINLSKNGKYAEAQQWAHYIFDPTDNSDGPTPERFWKVLPFQNTDVQLIENIMVNLSTSEDPKLREDTINCIAAWKENPFRPFLIARYRQSAYMFKAVFAYLDNLIAWGDDDFRKDQPEDVDAAMLKYVLAANILGPRPQEIPSKGSVKPQTYANLKKDLDEFGNAMRGLETDIPFNLAPPAADVDDANPANSRLTMINNLGNALYFSIPRNEQLLTYWDTVADRLFKIRNSLNLQGIFRQLPLFAPPIDPALLARAVAAGIDISAAVAGLNAPMPIVRFQLLLQKAVEICQEVKSLGSNLLAAMEKEDNEALSIIRARHEKEVLTLAESVKYSQWQESIKNKEGLVVSLNNASQRFIYYERQLGKKPDEIKLPELSELDAEGLLKMKFSAKEPEVSMPDIDINIAQDLGASGGKIMSTYEAEELTKSELARDIQDVIKGLNLAAQGMSFIPDFKIDLHFWGLGGSSDIMGGKKLSDASKFAADVALAYADRLSYESGRAGRIGSLDRRQQDWEFQRNTIAGEIAQAFKQLRAAQIREAMAEKEWNNHKQQIKNAEEIEQFLTDEKVGKKTSQALYAWMKREIKNLYNLYFQFSYDIAKQAERALQQELGNPKLSYIQLGYTSGKEGLLAGERLLLDLKRMEMAYHEQNLREYELTKHVSLQQLNPTALLQLRTTGRCTLRLPEEVFDMDGPGHYYRRIKTVAVSIPCVAGPYSAVNCTLTLTKSTIRTSALLSDGEYDSTGDNDIRFETHFGSMQSIVTSNAQNDSGMFEVNLKDERKLQFEYAGVVSEWELKLPGREGEIRQFNYDTISDIILHIRYTAREGGELLRKGAMKSLKDKIEAATAAGTTRLFSVRHEFPNEWEKFKTAQPAAGTTFFPLALTLREEHYPYWSKGSVSTTKSVMVLARSSKNSVAVRPSSNEEAKQDILTNTKTFNDLKSVTLDKMPRPDPIGALSWLIDDNGMTDLWIVINWGK